MSERELAPASVSTAERLRVATGYTVAISLAFGTGQILEDGSSAAYVALGVLTVTMVVLTVTYVAESNLGTRGDAA